MGEASNHKHAARIAAGEFGPDSYDLAAALGARMTDPNDAPASAALVAAARAAVAQAIPPTFEHGGRRYWLRLAIAMAHLEVFDDADSSAPVARTICGSSDCYGHAPGH